MTKGPDPAGLWNGFLIKADEDGQQWADFPTLGYSGDAVYIATKMLNVADNAQSGTHLVGIPKSSLTAAIPGITGFRKEEDINVGFDGTLQPAVDALGAANVYGYPYKAFSISPQNPGVNRNPGDSRQLDQRRAAESRRVPRPARKSRARGPAQCRVPAGSRTCCRSIPEN